MNLTPVQVKIPGKSPRRMSHLFIMAAEVTGGIDCLQEAAIPLSIPLPCRMRPVPPHCSYARIPTQHNFIFKMPNFEVFPGYIF